MTLLPTDTPSDGELDFLVELPTPVLVDDNLGNEPEAFVLTADNRQVPATLKARLEQCGALRHRCDLKSGRRIGYYQRCGLHLYCPRCLEDRAEKERTRVTLAAGTRPLKRVEVSPEEAKNVIRALPSRECRRYPQEKTVVILHTDPEGPGEEVDPNELDWQELTKTPTGSNISGKLGNDEKPPAQPTASEDVKVVRYQSFVVDDPLKRPTGMQTRDYEACWELATLATAHLVPDLDTIGECARERMRHYKNLLLDRAYKIKFYVYGYERVRASDIDWQPYNLSIRKKLGKEGIANPILDRDLIERAMEPPPEDTPF